MSLAKAFLSELDHEMVGTRKHLERIPEDKLGWKPHEKSMAMGRLGSHIAEMLLWLRYTLVQDGLDLAPPGEEPLQALDCDNVADLLKAFDENLTTARAALDGYPDDKWKDKWTLASGGHEIMSMPRGACVRSMILNHIIHHRAQLGVYLRLHDIPVPGVYGPSADDK